MNTDEARAKFESWMEGMNFIEGWRNESNGRKFSHYHVPAIQSMWLAYQQATKEGEGAIEENPNFEAFIRAFWRRIEPYKNDYDKELPEKLPVEFKAHMATAFLALKEADR